MKIYTKTGDDGTTGLIGGARVGKDDARLDCYGTVDELNATLGLAAVALGAGDHAPVEAVRRAQADLFVLGSHLATPADKKKTAKLPPLDPAMVNRLEAEIDAAEAGLAPLMNFILPGGTDAAARLHLARCVCRRAERRLLGFEREAAGHDVDPVVKQYLNRLSDWLFVQARAANAAAGVADLPWHPEP